MAREFGVSNSANSRWFAKRIEAVKNVANQIAETEIALSKLAEVAGAMVLRTKTKQGDHEVEIYQGRLYRGAVICRSMEKPETIVGFKVGYALIDDPCLI